MDMTSYQAMQYQDLNISLNALIFHLHLLMFHDTDAMIKEPISK